MTHPFHTLQGCFSSHIGSLGLTTEEMTHWKQKALDAFSKLSLLSLPALQITQETADLPELDNLAVSLREKFSHFVVFGTGGSSLGGQTLSRWAPRCPHSSRTLLQKPVISYMDNIDPDTFASLFHHLPLDKTFFLVISKSGETAETVMQFLYTIQAYKDQALENKIRDHFLMITEEKPNSLRQLAQAYGIPVLPHHPHIGGRFSVFSNVALLPAALEGVDIRAVRQGAARCLQEVLENPQTHAAIEGAALADAFSESRSINTTVLLPYQDKLTELGLWYRQLWAESLGKEGKGTTPILSRGTVDQHSQLQLYLDGPRDKFFTVIMPEPHHTGPLIPDTSLDSISYLSGHTMKDLLWAEAQATVTTLQEKGCPTRCLYPGPITEETGGYLLMHFMIETLLTAALWEVDPITQPAVERGKILTKEFL